VFSAIIVVAVAVGPIISDVSSSIAIDFVIGHCRRKKCAGENSARRKKSNLDFWHFYG